MSRAVASLSCAGFDETDHSDAGSRGLALLSQSFVSECPGQTAQVVSPVKKKKEWRGQGGSFLGLLLENLGLFLAVGIDASSYY